MKKKTKICPSCESVNPTSKRKCLICGFKLPSLTKKKATFSKEKRLFKKNMLQGQDKEPMVNNTVVKKVFEEFAGNEEFLSLVKKPFNLKNLLYFRTANGRKYLKVKLSEFNRPEEAKKEIVSLDKRVGDDIVVRKPITLRNFLNG